CNSHCISGCTSQCDDSTPCPEGSSCVDNQCCTCSKEEFTLILRNLTFEDSGRYKCQIANQSEQLEFQVEVLESGLKGGFHENISYDHSECCQEKGISPLCRAMCKPSEMAEHHFDPTSCKTDDYKNFLYCATENGTRSHIHCCKTQLVPSFCYDFCSGDFKMLRRAHRLCLYYLPEIFDCYNRAYRMLVNPPLEHFRSRDSVPSSLSMGVRRKRDTVVVMTRDEATNSTTIREFNFQQINTTGTCQTITDLRSSTRYIVYVTSRNEYGTSVPSVRSIASTNIHTVKNNESIPDVMSGFFMLWEAWAFIPAAMKAM
ncbi:DB module, partial [Ancylostoma duodenale]